VCAGAGVPQQPCLARARVWCAQVMPSFAPKWFFSLSLARALALARSLSFSLSLSLSLSRALALCLSFSLSLFLSLSHTVSCRAWQEAEEACGPGCLLFDFIS